MVQGRVYFIKNRFFVFRCLRAICNFFFLSNLLFSQSVPPRSDPQSNSLPFNILKNKPQHSYPTESRFIAETTFTEANYTSSCFTNSNFANYSNLSPNFTNSAHVFKQTRPRKKQQFSPKGSPSQHCSDHTSHHRDLESVFNPPAIPSRFSTEKSQIKPVKDSQFRGRVLSTGCFFENFVFGYKIHFLGLKSSF